MNCSPLTAAELKSTNGCGSSYLLLAWARIPFLFRHCCDRHDLRYQRAEDKDRADDEMLDCMYYAAYHGPRWSRGLKLIVADLAYLAITSSLSNICYAKGARP